MYDFFWEYKVWGNGINSPTKLPSMRLKIGNHNLESNENCGPGVTFLEVRNRSMYESSNQKYNIIC